MLCPLFLLLTLFTISIMLPCAFLPCTFTNNRSLFDYFKTLEANKNKMLSLSVSACNAPINSLIYLISISNNSLSTLLPNVYLINS